jgi:hypothetical protein
MFRGYKGVIVRTFIKLSLVIYVWLICFMGRACGWGGSFKCRVELQYCIVLGPLFWESPYIGAMGFILHLSFMVEEKMFI